ncbi:MAG: tyrosine--tRNA ligase [Planctomycetota bacterium]
MSIESEVERQLRLLARGVVDCVSREELAAKLKRSLEAGRPLRAKLGVDPTAPDIHLGHTVVLRKLRQFQELGHQAVLIIGSGTAMVGDPSGRDRTRPTLSAEAVQANAQTYMMQAGKIIELGAAEVVWNGEWFEKMVFFDFIRLASRMTVARMLERDLFAKRYREGVPISLHEFIYPLMQGWDSVEVRADVEIGGTDQLFNLLVGRDLMRDEGLEPQVCLTTQLLEGLDGSQKMSKSLGNYIGVNFDATDMYGKVMSIPDSLMEKYYVLLTDVDELEIADLLSERTHPREAKQRLAHEIVATFHGGEAARRAGQEFDRVFRDRELPQELPEVRIPARELSGGSLWVVRLLVLLGFAKSNGEARRLVAQGAVRLDGRRLLDAEAQVRLDRPVLVQAGKRRFARALAAE